MGDAVAARGRPPLLLVFAAFAAAAVLSLPGCAKREGLFEKAGRKADRAVDDASKEIEKAADQTRQNLADAKKKATETTDAVSEKAHQVGEDASREAKKAADAAARMAEGIKREIEKPDPPAKSKK